jgi:hypothetical protein
MDHIIATLSGPPFYYLPEMVMEMTLPQVVFSWAKKQEWDATQTKQAILATTVSIGGALSKEGGRHLKHILEELSGPTATDVDLMDSLDEEAALVMFGKRRLSGRRRNPD